MNGKMFQVSLVLFLLVYIGCSPKAMAISGLGKVTIKIVDENNQPIEGANVGIGFSYEKPAITILSPKDGISDSNGLFSASAKTDGYIGFTVTKNNYYESTGSFQFEKLSLLHWKPWNPELTVVLREIENPVPMYARNTLESILEIPVIGEAVGFDLTKFDWVPPYGGGIHADFIFKLEKKFQSRKDFKAKLTLTFSNNIDGLREIREGSRNGSIFKLPRIASDDGYKSVLELEEWRKPEGQIERNYDFISDDINFFFRVRSDEKDGVLEQAMYGKILGPLHYDPIFSKTAKIYFKYYLNPDYTRNLEYDPERNLFRALPLLEQVGIQ